MKRVEMTMPQGSVEWHIARLGKVTASHAADVVTPTGKATANAKRETYLNQLITETLRGKITQNFVNDAMKRGTELEPSARRDYQLERGILVRQVGFVMRDDVAGCGCSPDGITEDGRLLEIKCPTYENLIAKLRSEDPTADYIMQVQFQLWICGMDVCDLFLYSDDDAIVSKIFSITKDEKLHAAFSIHVPSFVSEVTAGVVRMIAMGCKCKDPAITNAPSDEGIPEGFGPLPEGVGRAQF